MIVYFVCSAIWKGRKLCTPTKDAHIEYELSERKIERKREGKRNRERERERERQRDRERKREKYRGYLHVVGICSPVPVVPCA